jgi:MYXO-CTERM domain-containing protein
MAILSSRGSMGRIGLFGPALLDVPTMPWSYTTTSDVDLPVVKQESHRAGWTVFGLLMLAAAFLGRRSSK